MRFCVWWFSWGVLISKLAAWNKVLSPGVSGKFLKVELKQVETYILSKEPWMDAWLNALLLNVRFAVQRTPLCYLMITACGKVDVCLISAWSILLPPGHRLDQSVSTADRDIRWCTNTSRQCASIRSGLQFFFWWLWLLGFAEMSHFSSIWSLIHSQYLAGPPPYHILLYGGDQLVALLRCYWSPGWFDSCLQLVGWIFLLKILHRFCVGFTLIEHSNSMVGKPFGTSFGTVGRC